MCKKSLRNTYYNMRYGEIKSRSEKAQNRERGETFSPNFECGRGIEREQQWGGKNFGIKLKK